MSKTRTGDAFMPADEFGRSLPKLSVNSLVRNVETSLKCYSEVLDATVRYSDHDFAAMRLLDVDFLLHADHTYDHHTLYPLLTAAPVRGAGAELRFLGVDPDKVEERAKSLGMRVVQSAKVFPHGWREVTVLTQTGMCGPWASRWRNGGAIRRKAAAKAAKQKARGSTAAWICTAIVT